MSNADNLTSQSTGTRVEVQTSSLQLSPTTDQTSTSAEQSLHTETSLSLAYWGHIIGLSLLLILLYYNTFRMVPALLIVMYIPFMAFLAYIYYIKWIRWNFDTTTAKTAQHIMCANFIGMVVYHFVFFEYVVACVVKFTISDFAQPYDIPFLGTALNYGFSLTKIDMVEELGTAGVIFFNAVPAAGFLSILFILYIGLRFSKTHHEYARASKTDPLLKAHGMVSSAKSGIAQMGLKLQGKEKADLSSVEDEALRSKLAVYNHVVPNEICPSCHYEGCMGLMKTAVPWYFSWWFLLLLAFTGVGLISAC